LFYASTAELQLQILTSAFRIPTAILTVDDMTVGLTLILPRFAVVTMIVAGLAIRMASIRIRSTGMCERDRREKGEAQ
jgi:hypothetical protein